MIAIKDNAGRANAVKITFFILAGLNFILLYSNIVQYILTQRNADRGFGSRRMLIENAFRQQILLILVFMAGIACIICFMMWFYRAYENVHALKINTLNFSAGWAIGAWFVPFLNLGRPYVIMCEIWDETQEFALPKNEKFMISSSAIVGWWWTFWLLRNVTTNIASFMTITARHPDAKAAAALITVVSSVVAMAAIILVLVMVYRMAKYEQKLAAHVHELNNTPAPEPTPAL